MALLYIIDCNYNDCVQWSVSLSQKHNNEEGNISISIWDKYLDNKN